jgi:hypothetical protein
VSVPTADVAEDGQSQAVVDELLHDLAGQPGAELEEVVVQTAGWHGHPGGVVAEGVADEVEGVTLVAHPRAVVGVDQDRRAMDVPHRHQFSL